MRFTIRNIFKIILLFTFFILLIRIDYRTDVPGKYAAGDDPNYYFHNQTIVYDFDLDYQNNSPTDRAKFLNRKTQKLVPQHPIGSTFFTAPFMFIGRIIEDIFKISNFHYFFYSLSSIFYLFLSFKLITHSMYIDSLNKKLFASLFFSGGLIYFSFERFSLTHIYEVLSVCILLKLSKDFSNQSKEIKISFLLGLLSVLFINIRLINYFLLLTPIFYFLIFSKKDSLKKLFTNGFYYLGLSLGALINYLLQQNLYGSIVLNPSTIYNPSNSKLVNFLSKEVYSNTIVETVTFIFNTLKTIIFSSEFGILYVTPVLVVSIPLIFKLLYKKNYATFLITSIIFLIPFGVVLLWQTTASSFGYRYLYVLVPYALLIVNSNLNIKKYSKAVYFLSTFSFLTYLFFETSPGTSLSEQVNKFGRLHTYSAPDYIEEMVVSAFQLNSYLHIIFTSFLGVIIIKFFVLIIGKLDLINIIDNLGYLNDDVSRLIDYSETIGFFHVVSLIFLFLYCYRCLIKNNQVNQMHNS